MSTTEHQEILIKLFCYLLSKDTSEKRLLKLNFSFVLKWNLFYNMVSTSVIKNAG